MCTENWFKKEKKYMKTNSGYFLISETKINYVIEFVIEFISRTKNLCVQIHTIPTTTPFPKERKIATTRIKKKPYL